MTIMPNPFTDTVASASQEATVTAAASPLPIAAAAGPVAEPAGEDDTDCINEIFYYARKLSRDRRFQLDVDRFMNDIDEAPLFLRSTG